MYQPAHGRFVVDDPIGLLAELASTVPATLVTHGPGGFRASILPADAVGPVCRGPRGARRPPRPSQCPVEVRRI